MGVSPEQRAQLRDFFGEDLPWAYRQLDKVDLLGADFWGVEDQGFDPERNRHRYEVRNQATGMNLDVYPTHLFFNWRSDLPGYLDLEYEPETDEFRKFLEFSRKRLPTMLFGDGQGNVNCDVYARIKYRFSEQVRSFDLRREKDRARFVTSFVGDAERREYTRLEGHVFKPYLTRSFAMHIYYPIEKGTEGLMGFGIPSERDHLSAFNEEMLRWVLFTHVDRDAIENGLDSAISIRDLLAPKLEASIPLPNPEQQQ